MLIINSNYDAFGVGHDAPIEALFERLQKYALDPAFERYGDFCFKPYHWTRDDGGKIIDDLTRPLYPDAPDTRRVFGNFFDVSGVFNLDTDEQELIAKLRALIAANKATPAYAAARQECRKPSWYRKPRAVAA